MIRCLGANLRTARLRRKLTIEEVAQTIGTRPRVMDAVKVKPSTGTAVYTALRWTYDLLSALVDLPDPAAMKGHDPGGQAAASTPAAPGNSTMTSECLVYIMLSGATEFVTTGRFVLETDRTEVSVGRFVDGRSYLQRPNAVAIDLLELELGKSTYSRAALGGVSGALRNAVQTIYTVAA